MQHWMVLGPCVPWSQSEADARELVAEMGTDLVSATPTNKKSKRAVNKYCKRYVLTSYIPIDCFQIDLYPREIKRFS